MVDYPQNLADAHLMGENVRPLLRRCGKGVVIRPLAKIAFPERVEIDDYCVIDDFVFINGSGGIKIGKFVHLALASLIVGGGQLEMADFSGLSPSCRLITGTDDFSGNSLTNSAVPEQYKPFLFRGRITIGRHAILGTNTIVAPSIIHPHVRIGQFAATAAATVVNADLQENFIYSGNPAQKIKPRPSEKMLRLEQQLMQEMYGK